MNEEIEILEEEVYEGVWEVEANALYEVAIDLALDLPDDVEDRVLAIYENMLKLKRAK